MHYLVAIPCMDMIHAGFFRSVLAMTKLEGTRFSMTMSSLIYDARNTLAKQAITGGFDRVLWLDSDMEFAPDLMSAASRTMRSGANSMSLSSQSTRSKPPVIACFARVFLAS